MSLLVTPGQTITEPVSLDDVKARLRLTSTVDDAVLTEQITQAREFCERLSKRSLAYKSYVYILDRFPFPMEPLRIPVPPLVSITALKFYDSTLTQQTWDPADYWVANNQVPALLIPNPGTIYPPSAHVPGAVELDFNAGWGYPGQAAGGGNPAIPAGPTLPQEWQRSIINTTIFIYENAGAQVPEHLCQIPKVFLF